MEYLWPYKQAKNKYYFRDGKKRLVITKLSEHHWQSEGDIIDKPLMWNIGYTPNLGEVKITHKKS